ncbi:Crp/Fnr family transcriptional regulator [Streptococcus oralis]|uniref:Transcriptional regulator, Crp/Fnr family n=1 Tax=Streptococcus oralis TaxID=1303 RepID=A0A139PFT6_STROR|nr:Crp/Fnr family transcriptional regulator [Streptococcus oralis]KXT88000.1 transcriptional regulator, Crp/Fnr family [Streptococcus oralis]
MSQSCFYTIPLFSTLSYDELQSIHSLFHHKKFKKGELIFSPFDEESLIIVNRGQFKVYRLTNDGTEQCIRIIDKGNYEGENYLFEENNQDLYGEALVSTEICIIHKKDFQHLLQSFPHFSWQLLRLNARKAIQTEEQVTLLTFEKIEQRLACYLIHLAEESDNPKLTFTLPISEKELASYLGTRPETISRKFKIFEKHHYIQKTRRTIHITDAHALRSLY